MERVFYAIDEKLAKNSRGMWSFTDYVMGSSTKEYKSVVEDAYLKAEQVAQVRPENAEQAEKLAERFSRKYAAWVNKKHSIDMMCPSVMICGAGNFPTRKKEKQVARIDRHYKEYDLIMEIPQQINSLLYRDSIIKSGDSEVIEKLQEKLQELESMQDSMKKANAYCKKNGSLKGFEGFAQDTIDKITEEMTNSWHGNKPFPSYSLTNNNAKIKSTKERLDRITKVKERGTQEKEVSADDGNELFKVVENVELMRLQLLFDGKPDAETRDILKKNGFKWSPKNEAWQRQLTNNARYGLKRVIEQLKPELA